MNRVLIIVLGLFSAVTVSAGEIVGWRVAAIYSPTVVNERREGETDAHYFAHSFVVAPAEKSEHPAIQRITVGPFIVDSAESKRRMKKIEPLTADTRVVLMIEVPSEVFESAEKSVGGVLWVDSDQVEVLDEKDRANQAPLPTPGKCPPSNHDQLPGAADL